MQIDLIDIFRIFQPKAAEYTYFSSACRTFSRIGHMLGHRISLNKFKKIEIISSISDHNAMKLEMNHKNSEKHMKTWKLNNMLLNNEWINKKIEKEIIRYLETNENEDTTISSLWDTGKVILRGKFIALQAYLKKQENGQINNLTSHLKEFEREQQSPQ